MMYLFEKSPKYVSFQGYELFFPFIDQFPELDDVITLLEKLEELVKV